MDYSLVVCGHAGRFRLWGGGGDTSPGGTTVRTICGQLSNLLFNDQYILTYTSQLGDATAADLTVEVAGALARRAIPLGP